jgi:hypothetical protein
MLRWLSKGPADLKVRENTGKGFQKSTRARHLPAKPAQQPLMYPQVAGNVTGRPECQEKTHKDMHRDNRNETRQKTENPSLCCLIYAQVATKRTSSPERQR